MAQYYKRKVRLSFNSDISPPEGKRFCKSPCSDPNIITVSEEGEDDQVLEALCYAECDKIAKWQFFMSRHIFLNQVFYIHGKFLYIHVKKIYSLSMRLASYMLRRM